MRDRPLFLDPNLNIIFGVTLLAVLGVSSIAPVFPTVARELDVAPEAVGLLITVFTMPGIILTPIFGILADRFGRKKILVPALLLFSLAGSSCSLARDFELLLLLRFLQGVGAASLGSLNATLIGDLFSGRRRTEAMGYNASILSVGTAIYPS
ncbi:MAG: MFS transporter, partial [Gemmatimonadota bacterium]